MSENETATPADKVERAKESPRELDDLNGRAWCVGDGVSTDHICPNKYFELRSDPPALAEHTLEHADLQTTDGPFMEAMEPGDFVVAGENFGQGSSREYAALILELSGVSAVLAESFARIFYRNAVNLGLPVITCDTSSIDERDQLHADLSQGVVVNRAADERIDIQPLSDVMESLLTDGGLKEHVRKHGELSL